MTKKEKLKWRLGKLPTVEELRELVKDKIITQDEAREILFSSEIEESRDEKSLKQEIKFLRELVEKLATGNQGRIVEIIREVEKPWRRYPWYEPYVTWATSTGNNLLSLSTSTDLSEIGAMTDITTGNFSDIKTF